MKKQKSTNNLPNYLIIALFAILPYIITLSYGYVECDDSDLIFKYYDRIDSFNDIPTEVFRGYLETDYYRPMMNLSFILNESIAKQNPAYYHLFNMALHALFCISLFVLFIKLKISKNISLFFMLLFAVHPILVNSVAWIVGRNDILYGLFSVLSFIYLLKNEEAPKTLFLILHALFLFFAFLSKETALAFPFIMLVYLLVSKKELKNISKYVVLWVFAAALWLFMRSSSELSESVNISGLDIVIFNLPLIPEFFAKFFLPLQQSVLATYSSMNTIIGIVVMIAVTALIFFKKERDNSRIIFALSWIFLLILPGMYVTLGNSDVWNEYLECRFYLPAAGLILLMIFILPEKIVDLIENKIKYLYLLLIIPALLTFIESRNYKGPVEFYESAIDDDTGRPLFNNVLFEHYIKSRNFEKAESVLQNSIKEAPAFVQTYYNLGLFYFRQRRYNESYKYLNDAIRLDSNYIPAYKALPVYYLQAKRYKEALELNKIAYKKWPEDKDIAYNLISDLIMAEDYQNAMARAEEYAELKEHKPRNDEGLSKQLYKIGVESYQDSLFSDAERALQIAVKIDSKNNKAAGLLNFMKTTNPANKIVN